jgi:transcriptional regulator with XRE-family HTH domain
VLRPSPDLSTLGRLLRTYRSEAHLTQEMLGYRSGLARNYVGKVERGEANISFLSIERWLAATGVTWKRLGRDLERPSGITSPSDDSPSKGS